MRYLTLLDDIHDAPAVHKWLPRPPLSCAFRDRYPTSGGVTCGFSSRFTAGGSLKPHLRAVFERFAAPWCVPLILSCGKARCGGDAAGFWASIAFWRNRRIPKRGAGPYNARALPHKSSASAGWTLHQYEFLSITMTEESPRWRDPWTCKAICSHSTAL